MRMCPPCLHREADDRNFEQFFLGDETRIARHEAGDREGVKEALVIGNENVRFRPGKILKPLDFHLDSANPNYPAPPRPSDRGDPVRLVHQG